MNPYTTTPGVVRQLFVSEPFNNTIAVVNLIVFGAAPNQVFGLGSVSRISSDALNFPVDRAPAQRDVDNVSWASNTTLDQGSDFYVANRGDKYDRRMRSQRDASRSTTSRWKLPASTASPPRRTARRSCDRHRAERGNERHTRAAGLRIARVSAPKKIDPVYW
jgi:hypothetical protein